MLFSEPKIPQSTTRARPHALPRAVSVLFSEPKIPQCSTLRRCARSGGTVSVLFSEPKIPQWACVSAVVTNPTPFQCSSASRKFLNRALFQVDMLRCSSFSALQRAENSSMEHTILEIRAERLFQCSSASRKFLNVELSRPSGEAYVFQCSSASRKFLNSTPPAGSLRAQYVSVLFSEPKIPQSLNATLNPARSTSFSALQRAENSSMRCGRGWRGWFPQCFSALQRAENSSIGCPTIPRGCPTRFSALQRAENSSMMSHSGVLAGLYAVSVLFSEPKIPQF